MKFSARGSVQEDRHGHAGRQRYKLAEHIDPNDLPVALAVVETTEAEEGDRDAV